MLYNSNTKKKSMSHLNNMFKTSSERSENITSEILQKRRKKKAKDLFIIVVEKAIEFLLVNRKSFTGFC